LDLKSSQKSRASDPAKRAAAIGTRTSGAQKENSLRLSPLEPHGNPSEPRSGAIGAMSDGSTFKPERTPGMAWSEETRIPGNTLAVAPTAPTRPEQGQLPSRTDDVAEAAGGEWTSALAIVLIAALVIGVMALRRFPVMASPRSR
jgi:hypothetical protein